MVWPALPRQKGSRTPSRHQLFDDAEPRPHQRGLRRVPRGGRANGAARCLPRRRARSSATRSSTPSCSSSLAWLVHSSTSNGRGRGQGLTPYPPTLRVARHQAAYPLPPYPKCRDATLPYPPPVPNPALADSNFVQSRACWLARSQLGRLPHKYQQLSMSQHLSLTRLLTTTIAGTRPCAGHRPGHRQRPATSVAGMPSA